MYTFEVVRVNSRNYHVDIYNNGSYKWFIPDHYFGTGKVMKTVYRIVGTMRETERVLAQITKAIRESK